MLVKCYLPDKVLSTEYPVRKNGKQKKDFYLLLHLPADYGYWVT